MNNNNMLDHALKLRKLGLSVIPLKSDKTPLIPWKKYQECLSTQEEITAWWTENPFANIGVVTGAITGLVVIDLDGFEAQERFIAKVGEIPNTIRQITGKDGGLHLFFRHPGPAYTINSRVGIFPRIDVRADGGYVVVAPSRHPSGRRYQWIIDPTICGLDNLLDLPESIMPTLVEETSFKGQHPKPFNSLDRCAFLKHCREDAETLSEQEWFLMVALVAPHYGGPALVHELSASYPVYTTKETDEKILHVLKDCPGPPTCETVKKVWNCHRNCGVTTPAELITRLSVKNSDDSDGGDDAVKDLLASDQQLIPIIPCPTDVLPEQLDEFIGVVAKTVHVSREIVLGAALAILAGAIGNKVRVSPKIGWETPIFLWMIIIEPTGCGKSPAINTLMEPIYSLQKGFTQEYQKLLKDYEAKQGKGGSGDEERPRQRHLVTSDCTIEALGKIFSEDGHGLIVHRDELAGLILSFNQYKSRGGGDDLQKYLQLFDCQPFKIDRKQESLFIQSCGASIIGGIQPPVLATIFNNKTFDNGLFPRFLMIYEEPAVKTFSQETLNTYMKLLWDELIKNSFYMRWDGPPRIIFFSEEARDIWAAFYNELNSLQPLLTERLQVFIPKIITYSLRLIGLLHCLEHVIKLPGGFSSEPRELPIEIITKETVEKGIRLTRYFAGQVVKTLPVYEKNQRTSNGQIVRLAETLSKLRGEVKAGKLYLKRINEVYNGNLPETAKFSPDNKNLSALLRKLGFETTSGTAHYAYLVWDEQKIEYFFRKNITTITNLTNQAVDPKSFVETDAGDVSPVDPATSSEQEAIKLGDFEIVE